MATGTSSVEVDTSFVVTRCVLQLFISICFSVVSILSSTSAVFANLHSIALSNAALITSFFDIKVDFRRVSTPDVLVGIKSFKRLYSVVICLSLNLSISARHVVGKNDVNWLLIDINWFN